MIKFIKKLVGIKDKTPEPKAEDDFLYDEIHNIVDPDQYGMIIATLTIQCGMAVYADKVPPFDGPAKYRVTLMEDPSSGMATCVFTLVD